MRSTSFNTDYLATMDRETDKLFRTLTNDYMLKCDNYSVAYMLLPIIDRLQLCERSDITDDYFFPYSSIIFFTCRPDDAERIECVAKRLPSSIRANVKLYQYDADTGEDVEV